MSGPFNPDAYLAKTRASPKRPGTEFNPDAYLEKAKAQVPRAAEAGSPLDRALAEQSGDIVTVETPTGPAKFTRDGARFYDADESAQYQEAADARLKERVLEGGLSLFSGGGPMVDEFAGAKRALSSLFSPGKSFGDEYHAGQDQARVDVARATRNASPNMEVAGTKLPVLPMLGAAVPSLLAPLPVSWMGRIGSSVVQGIEAGAGSSTADLTGGEGSQFLRDVGSSAGVSALAGVGAEVIGAPLRMLGNAAGREATAAKAAALAAEQAAADKAARSATSALGGVTAGINHDVQWAERVLLNPSAYLPEEQAAAQAVWNHPDAIRLRIQNSGNTLGRFGHGMSKEEAARTAMNQAVGRAQPVEVAGRIAEKTEPSAIAADLLDKGWRSIGQRAMLGAAGSGAGASAAWLAGEDPKAGAALGATAGFLPQGALQFMRNQAKSPVVQYGANALTQRLLGSGAGLLAKEGALVAPVTQSTRPADPLEKDRAAIQAYLTGG